MEIWNGTIKSFTVPALVRNHIHRFSVVGAREGTNAAHRGCSGGLVVRGSLLQCRMRGHCRLHTQHYDVGHG